MQKIHDMENAIIRKLVEDALRLGYTVKHNDGERETCTIRANTDDDVAHIAGTILHEIHATDIEYLIFYVGESRIGYVVLVYGNDGYDVIADHTATTEMENLLSGAMALADKLEEEAHK